MSSQNVDDPTASGSANGKRTLSQFLSDADELAGDSDLQFSTFLDSEVEQALSKHPRYPATDTLGEANPCTGLDYFSTDIGFFPDVLDLNAITPFEKQNVAPHFDTQDGDIEMHSRDAEAIVLKAQSRPSPTYDTCFGMV
jgi:hypothetical protein